MLATRDSVHSNHFKVVTYESPAGKFVPMSGYHCAGCTLMFKDSKLFSVLMLSTHNLAKGSLARTLWRNS